MKYSIDIYGGLISKNVFEKQDIIKVNTYISNNSLMAMEGDPVIIETDSIENISSYEKEMLRVDFSKGVFEKLKFSHCKYIMIDLGDEIGDLVRVKTKKGENTIVTNSGIFCKLLDKNILGFEVLERINICEIHFSKVMHEIKVFATKIRELYREENIIINEVYPMGIPITSNYEEQKENDDFYRLKLYYALLEYELPKAYVIKMPIGESSSNNLDSFEKESKQYKQMYFENVYTKTVKYLSDNESISNTVVSKDIINNKENSEKYHFDATQIRDKNIVVWGTQIYFADNIAKFEKKYKNVKYVFPDGPINNEVCKKYKVLESVEQLKNIENCVVIIAKGRTQDVEKIAELLRQHSLQYDHMDFYLQEKLNVRYIKALKHYSYIDEHNNKFVLGDNIPDRVVIKRVKCKNATCIIGNNGVYKQLFIQLLGDSPHIKIGEKSSFVDVIINVCSKGKVIIGNENMFSHSITLAQSDMHHIFDLKTGKRINYPKEINIGNHVWVGREVELLGGAYISDNCVVGARTVTSGKFPENVIIAGCPGKIIRENIMWARDDLKTYDHDYYEQAVDKLGEKYLQKEE